LLADDQRHFRPDAPLTRADLATAIAQAVHLDAPEKEIHLTDVPEAADYRGDVLEVVWAKLLDLDAQARFRPDATVTCQEAEQALERAWKYARGPGARSPGFSRKTTTAKTETSSANAAGAMTRRQAAVELVRLMGL
jgi:hypothetical protein